MIESAVIIFIAVSMGAMFVTTTPAAFLASSQYNPPSREWRWENVTVVVREFRLPSRGARIDMISIRQDYYGITVQDIEENSIVEVHMRQV